MKKHLLNWLFGITLLIISFGSKIISQKLFGISPFDPGYIFIGFISLLMVIIYEPIGKTK